MLSSTVTKSVPALDGIATKPILTLADVVVGYVTVPLKAVTVTKWPSHVLDLISNHVSP